MEISSSKFVLQQIFPHKNKIFPVVKRRSSAQLLHCHNANWRWSIWCWWYWWRHLWLGASASGVSRV